MEASISKFIHVKQADKFWHQPPVTASFKSPDLIELNSDSERTIKSGNDDELLEPEQVNYSSSQEEVETEDDCGDAPDAAMLGKDGGTTVYDLTSNDEESCHLLQTEDDSENSDSEHGENSSKSSESRSSSSAVATISDGENTAPPPHDDSKSTHHDLHDYWTMTPEQDLYYTTQFFKLQPDLSGIITGKIAKIFFEKSKLDQFELKEIWQVADVTQDGNLDLNEFKTAMHLVVLRRHGLPLPPKGVSLISKENHSTDITRGQDSALFDGRAICRPSIKLKSQRNHVLKNVNSCNNDNEDQSNKAKEEWTTFDNEPVNFSSRCDTSGLVAPVPVRLTPEDSLFLSSTAQAGNKVQHLQLKSIQRPKLSGQQPKVSLGTIAPPPPPRRKTHVRSSSLDLNRLGINSSLDINHQPNNGNRRDQSDGRNFLSPANGGAFSVYRKPNKSVLGADSRSSLASYDRQEIMELRQEVIELKNDNVILAGITTQLLDQLSGLEAKRGELTSQIQQWLSLRTTNYIAPSSKHS